MDEPAISTGRRARRALCGLLLAPALGGIGGLGAVGASGCARPRPVEFRRPANLVLIVVDTLRADHLPFHGYWRDTAPNATRLFSDQGVVFDSAYAPSAWTPPSVAAILTGLKPARLAPADVRRFVFPETEPTIAQRVVKAGYGTGGFQGNLLLGEGFSRGFQHYFMTGTNWESIALPADAVLRPALDWLAKPDRRDAPFFLYAHFVDPHGPYTGARRRGLATEFDPDYAGEFTGDETHLLNAGLRSLSADPDADLRHLTALYDEEILVADLAVGELVAAVEARAGDRPTLFVLTADHGEELQDHGGWTHGRTLYQEIVHVPLAFRLAGVVPGGRRVSTPVSLLDIAPTLLAAAGLESPPLDGQDLLPVLLDPRRRPEPKPIHLRSWQRGPLRLGLVEGRKKTLVYNRGEPFRPDPGLETHLAAEDDRRLPRAASFDLGRDPVERRALPPDPEHVEKILAEALPTIDGVRFLLRDVAPGATVSGRLHWRKTPRRLYPLLLGEHDRIARYGRRVEFSLRSELLPKGFVVQGDIVALERLELDAPADGSSIEVELGRGSVALPARRRDLTRPDYPAWTGRRSLRIWYLRAAAPESATMPTLDEETARRLKALGYL